MTVGSTGVGEFAKGAICLRLQYMRLELAQVVDFKLNETWQLESSRMSSRPFNSTRLD